MTARDAAYVAGWQLADAAADHHVVVVEASTDSDPHPLLASNS